MNVRVDRATALPMRLLFPLVVMVCSMACGAPRGEGSASDEPASISSTVTTAPLASATLFFRDDWSVASSAALMKDGEARLEYDARRVTNCLGDFNGHPGWTVTAHVKAPNGIESLLTVAGFFASGQKPAVVPLTHAGTWLIWFEITNRWGCQEWDSNYGKNYSFEVFAPAIIHFIVGRTPSVEGTLADARAVALDYPLDRLPNCRQTYAGLPSWELLSFARFDGSLFQTPATRLEGATQRVSSYAVYAVPPGSKALEVWFLNSDRGGCTEWDSDFGHNYHFDL